MVFEAPSFEKRLNCLKTQLESSSSPTDFPSNREMAAFSAGETAILVAAAGEAICLQLTCRGYRSRVTSVVNHKLAV